MSAVETMSTSSCPTPTVSMITTSLPAASRTSAASDGRAREPAKMAASGHAANEHAGIGGVGVHPDPIAKHGAARERAGRVDGDHTDLHASSPNLRDEAIDERALAGSWRAGHANQKRATGLA